MWRERRAPPTLLLSGNRHKPGHRWATAGVGVVLLALFLAGFGLYFAVSRTRLTADVRIAGLRDEAIRLAITANGHVTESTAGMMARAAASFRDGTGQGPFGAPGQPRWITGAFIWNGYKLTSWTTVGAKYGDLEDDREFADLVGTTLSRIINDSSPVSGTQIRYVSKGFRGHSLLLAAQVFSAESDRPFVAAVGIDLPRLKQDFLDVHFSASGRLHVVADESIPHRYWREPISQALNPLRVEPAPAYIAAQHRGVRIQIALYGAVTVLFVVALSVMIWKFIRLVQREVALSRLKSDFVADVSHELKTPLALIRMFSEMLGEGRVPTEEKKKEYYGIITRESTRLTHMIDNILDFSRIDAGKKQYTMQQVDIGQVVRATYEAYRYDLDRRGFEHQLAIADDLPQVYADADAMSQAILNLISNAVKYSHEEKKLAIDLVRETRRGKHGVLISVEDSGIGIRPEDRSHLFDGFFRATDDRVRRARGAGLGLSLVKSIVDAHGGSIDVESRLVKGTTFRIFLPQFTPTGQKTT